MSSSSHPSPLLLHAHLSLLPLSPPPIDLTLPLSLTQTSRTSSRTLLRDVLLSSLFDLLPSSSSPPQPSHAPSAAQNTAFVNAATIFLMELRKKGLDEGQEGGGGWGWKEVKGSVRKSDLGDAFGSRYEEVLLALSCQVVWEELKRKVNAEGALSTVLLPTKAADMLDQLPDLQQRFITLIEACLRVQAYAEAEVSQLERRWAALGERRDLVLANVSLSSSISSVPLERLEGIKQLKKNEWSKLVEQWLDMERVPEESRDGFSGAVEVADRSEGQAGGGNGVGASGGVGRVEMNNANLRSKSLPAAASLVQEQLQSLPSLVDSARTRLGQAHDSVVHRDTARKEENTPVESRPSEELSFWSEQARLVAPSSTSRTSTRASNSWEEDSSTPPLVRISSASPFVPSPLLNLVDLNPPAFSSAQRAQTIRLSLSQTSSSRPPVHPISFRIPADLPPMPSSPPPRPTQLTPPSPAPRRTPRKIGRPSAVGLDLRRQVLGSARKVKAMVMTPGRKTPRKAGRFDAFSRGTPLRARRFELQMDDGWEEEEGVSLTLEEMAAAQGSALDERWDSSFLGA